MARIYRAYFAHVDNDGQDLDVGMLHDKILTELVRQCVPTGTLYLVSAVHNGRFEPATVLEVLDPERGLELGAPPGAVVSLARRVKAHFRLARVVVTAQGGDTQLMEV